MTAGPADAIEVSWRHDPVTTPPPTPRTVDLTGLPEAVVSAVEWIVHEARAAAPLPPAVEVVRPPAGSSGPQPQPQVLPTPTFISRSTLSPEEFEQALKDMAGEGTGTVLPPDWSRADLYDDQD